MYFRFESSHKGLIRVNRSCQTSNSCHIKQCSRMRLQSQDPSERCRDVDLKLSQQSSKQGCNPCKGRKDSDMPKPNRLELLRVRASSTSSGRVSHVDRSQSTVNAWISESGAHDLAYRLPSSTPRSPSSPPAYSTSPASGSIV